MKASEFMIGNYVLAPKSDEFDLRLCKVFEIRNKQFRLIEVSTNMMFDQTRVEGIPLTEKWLEDFGFVGVTDDGLWQHEKEALFEIQNNYLNETWDHIWDTSFTGAPCQFVHQLQNLYFALTGTNLTKK